MRDKHAPNCYCVVKSVSVVKIIDHTATSDISNYYDRLYPNSTDIQL